MNGTISTSLGPTLPAVTGTALPTGWTTHLVRGLAVFMSGFNTGTYRPGGVYTAGEVGIYDRLTPATGKTITLAAYPIGGNSPGLADHETGLQIKVRGDTRPASCDDLADAVFELLDGLHGVTLAGIPLVQMWRQSYTSLGQDGNGRWERSENYYVQCMRPTGQNTD